MALGRTESWQAGWRAPVTGLLAVLLGYAIMGFVRPYAFLLMNWTGAFLGMILIPVLMYRARRKILPVRRVFAGIATIVLCILLISEGRQSAISNTMPSLEISERQVTVAQRMAKVRKYWEPTDWMPKVLDRKFATLAGIRKAYLGIGKNARSEIDKGVKFKNSLELLSYLPRAAQIVFLAPFPPDWFAEGSTKANTMMRRISMLEMLATYLALAALPFAFWRWRRRVELWVAAAFCSSVMLVYAVSIPNVGTLYRVRYGYLMVFITIGILAGSALWQDLRRNRVSTSDPEPQGTTNA